MGEILTYGEAEHIVQRLRLFELHELGSKEWHDQHSNLERINMQIHQNISFGRDEYISEMLSTYRKWDTVIGELICIHLFKTRIWPLVFEHLKSVSLADKQETPVSVLMYTIMFHEAILCDIFAAVLIDRLPQANNLDDLLDWSSAKLLLLTGRRLSAATFPGANFDPRLPGTAKADISLLGTLYQHECDINYKIGLTNLALIRGMLGNDLPLALMHKAQTNRVAVRLAQILTTHTVEIWGGSYPWQRVVTPDARSATKIPRHQYWEDGNWMDYKAESEKFFRLTKMEAQVWIGLVEAMHLSKEFTPQEIDVFEAIKGRINESLTDQLPVLKNLRLSLERLVLSKTQAGEYGQGSGASSLPYYQQKTQHKYSVNDPLTTPQDILEHAPGTVLIQTSNQIESCLLESLRKWSGDTMPTNDTIYAMAARKFTDLLQRIDPHELISSVYLEGYESVFPLCAVCSTQARFRCSKCQRVWYCGRECQVKDWKGGHKGKCGKMKDSNISITKVQHANMTESQVQPKEGNDYVAQVKVEAYDVGDDFSDPD